MCNAAAVELRHVKLQHFIKGPEMQLKHTATFERSREAQRKVDQRSE